MSYVLKLNNIEIAKTKYWSPNYFGNLTQTSYPEEVNHDYVWENDDYWLGWIPDPAPVQLTAEEIVAQQNAEIEKMRLEAYRNESDPLFFKWQRGEATEQDWLNKIAEIKARYPNV